MIFDIFYHAKNLQKAGFNESQVEAQVELARAVIEFADAQINLTKKQSTIILFDFFKHAKNLQRSGFTEVQADAQIELVKAQIEFIEAQVEFTKKQINNISRTVDNDLETKQDQDAKKPDPTRIDDDGSESKIAIAQMKYKRAIVILSIFIVIGFIVLGFLIQMH